MIKGIARRGLEFEGRFDANMSNFLSSVNSASATFKGSKIEIDGKITDNSEIRFNFSLSITNYRTSLNKDYNYSISELESTLSETYNKFDKLFLIVKLIAELESFSGLLINDTNGTYSHKLFEFYNLSEDKKEKEIIYTETNFQEYYKWMDHYLKKMLSFLINLKEITEKTNQSDFVLPQSMLPNKNTSTKDNPLEYFEYLFTRQGLFYLKQSFIPTEDDYYYGNIYYDSKTETIYEPYEDEESGDSGETPKPFIDFYHRRLYSEYQISCKFIDDFICSKNDEAAITLFIKITISKLKYLLISIDSYEDAKKYDISKKPIDSLILFFHKKYAVFIPKDMLEESVKDDSIVNNTPKISQQIQLLSFKNFVSSFKWKLKQDKALSTALWQKLKDNEFIDSSTELDVFHKAFDGIALEHPIKIQWTAKGKNKQINKHLLFYLFNKLADHKLIIDDTDNKIFKDRIRFIFCKSNGETLSNLDESNSTSSKKINKKVIVKTPDEIKIDEIIVALKQIAAEI
jgi:hypothetical protein